MKYKIVLLYIISMAFCMDINAQSSGILTASKLANSKILIIPINWIDTIDIQSVSIAIKPQWEDSIISIVDNYDYFIIENSEVYAAICPFYSSLRWHEPIVYMGKYNGYGGKECYKFPIEVCISHLSIAEQKHYKDILTKVSTPERQVSFGAVFLIYINHL